MKIRNSFVTNSSSSSFIVSTRTKQAEEVIRLVEWLCKEIGYPFNGVEDVTHKITGNSEEGLWGHQALAKRIKNKDTSLLGKKFYDVTIERSSEACELIENLIEAVDEMKIESWDSY